MNNSNSNNNNNNNNNKAFSLIELSIVLIIIGLLVAGITGGQSLIESAKVHSFYSSLNNYKQAFNTFYISHGRFPGDFNMDGRIGQFSNESINEKYFNFPYDGTNEANGYYLPNEFIAPFVELYVEKLIDFEPKGNETSSSNISNVKGISNVFCWYETIRDGMVLGSYRDNGLKSDTIYLQCSTNKYKSLTKTISNFAYKLDKKYDDGLYNYGDIRADCCGTYEDSIKNKCNCGYILYVILF